MSRGLAIRAWKTSLQPLEHPAPPQGSGIRKFSSSTALAKKGGKVTAVKANVSKDATNEDPYDFSSLEADVESVIERLKNDLSKLRAGGRFNTEVVENLRVQPDKNEKQTMKLSDLAQVIPKGRTVQLLVGEQDVSRPLV